MKVCAKCKRPFGDGDKYCKYCGAQRREIESEPVHRSRRGNIMEAVYGPPYSAKYVCPKCGNVYVESGLGAPSDRYCVECGAEYVMEKRGRGFTPPPDFHEDESDPLIKAFNKHRNKK